MIGRAALGGAGWYLLTIEDEAALVVRGQAAAVGKEVNEIKARSTRPASSSAKRTSSARRSRSPSSRPAAHAPVFVMYELASMLTDAQRGGSVTIDEEKYKKNKADDPQSEINPSWDPAGLWSTSVEETGGKLTIEARARRRGPVRSSPVACARAWFGEITHPDYERVTVTRDSDEGARHPT
ncbi:MAG: hypothetical protein U0168_25590 [Nannocystaceae bacterium]